MMGAPRHELKYSLSDGEAQALAYTLPGILRRDPHGGPEGVYRIRSLYFDDPARTAFRDKLDGAEYRGKFRLRLYNGDAGHILLEKKEKRGDLCWKTSLRISAETAQALIRGAPLPKGPPLLEELEALRRAALLTPSVLVEYDRAAFLHDACRTRITLDLNVRASPWQDGLFSQRTLAVPAMAPGEQILEVKYDQFLPAPAALALAGIPKHRMALSKYCKCLSALC